MRVLRLVCTGVVSVYLCASCLPQLRAQTPAPQQTPPAQPPAQQPTPPPKPATPPSGGFEAVPVQQQTAPPPRLETPKPAAPTAQPIGGKVIAGIEFRGARRTPQDTLKAQIYTKAGDIYNEETLRRDYMLLWNTGRFDDIRLEAEPGRLGLIVRFVLTERRVIRSIEYPGAKSVTVMFVRLPDSGETPLAAPVPVSTVVVPVIGGAVSISLPAIAEHEAMGVTITR